MKHLIQALSGLVVLLLACQVQAEALMMARTQQNFPEAMLKLQETLRNNGYTISRVQRVDIGLTKSGYQTDKYRVVFFGTPEENRLLTSKYPELIPYLPWKIAIFAEDQDTLLITADPANFIPGDQAADAKRILKRWSQDIQKIFDTMREEGSN